MLQEFPFFLYIIQDLENIFLCKETNLIKTFLVLNIQSDKFEKQKRKKKKKKKAAIYQTF